MKEFETIVGVTKALLQQLTGAAAQIKVQRIDEGGIDGDLCAIVTAGDKQAVAVVWPTAEKLKQIKQLAEVRQLYDQLMYNCCIYNCRINNNTQQEASSSRQAISRNYNGHSAVVYAYRTTELRC